MTPESSAAGEGLVHELDRVDDARRVGGVAWIGSFANAIFPAGGALTASGQAIHVGRSVALSEAFVIEEETERLIAHGTSRLTVFGALDPVPAAPAEVRERYGRTQFGQSVLLARRLVEAGVALVQVNWFRGADEPMDNPCWDSHVDETNRLKNNLVPPMDQAFSALIADLAERGLLDDTLVVCMSEFGRSPRINARGGRDHWGNVFSVALSGGGIRGGMVHGASDRLGGEPKDGLVRPPDLLATIYHCLGLDPHAELKDPQGRPFPISRGEPIRAVLA
jgi:uncharacterized protein (DUF1501 family)